jgi:hypothetical protein
MFQKNHVTSAERHIQEIVLFKCKLVNKYKMIA